MSNMRLLRSRGSLLCLLGIACLLVSSSQARAESRDDAQRRAFAALLARRAKAERAEVRAQTHKVSAATSAHLTRVTPYAINAVGLPPASPTAPSGYGFGRDAFVQGLYPEILGRDAVQSEVDYWSRLLVAGVSPQVIADRIWYSAEHRSLVQSGLAPGIPLKQAYSAAYAFGRANRFGPVP
jgi:hypothetical protein